jgi:hypothetical protein
VGVQFLNTTDTDLRIAWLDFDGHRSEELPEPLTVGEAVEVAGTYSGHAWAVYLDGGPCLAVYVAGAKAARATIRQQQLDEVRAARRSA